MRFIYLFILGLNFFVLNADSKNDQLYIDIKKCKINHIDKNAFDLKKVINKNSKLSITTSVRIRNKRINSAITEAKLKAKRKLIRFLEKENFDNLKIVRFSNNTFNYDLKGAIVKRICIQNGTLINLTLEINNRSITNAKKLNNFFIND